MKNIIFICHGSICRSPAAEFIAKQYLKSINKSEEYTIISRAVSYEEIGNDIYPPMKNELRKQGISFSYHASKILTQEDADWADYIFYMDESNARRILYYIKDNKKNCFPIFKFTPQYDEIEDPWYTDRYEKVVNQLKVCIKDIFDNI